MVDATPIELGTFGITVTDPPALAVSATATYGASNLGDGGASPFSWAGVPFQLGVKTVQITFSPGGEVISTSVSTPATAPTMTEPDGGETITIGDTFTFTGTTVSDAATDGVTYPITGPSGFSTALTGVLAAGSWDVGWDTTGLAAGDYGVSMTRDTAAADVTAGPVTVTLAAVANRHFTWNTLFASNASWPVPSDVQSPTGVDAKIRFTGWGGGGEGLANTQAGGGAECADGEISVTEGGTIALVVGAGGATGSGTANGADTTVGSTLLIAKGGTSGTGGGAGGTGGTGTTKNAGGKGATGTGLQAGGSSGGTVTAGSTTTPGAPDGAIGATGNANAPGAGGRSDTAVNGAGAAGLLWARYLAPQTSGYPFIVDITYGRDTANGTTRNITIPGGTGGKLLLFVVSDGNTAISATGWTALTQEDQVSSVCGNILYRDADGSDPVALATGASEQVAWVCVRVKSSSAGVPGAPEWTSIDGNSTNPNPPSHTPSGGSAAYLWFAFAGQDASATPVAPTAYPTGYAGFHIGQATNTGVTLALTWKLATAASDDPGVFTAATEQWIAGTCSIR